MPEIAQLAGGVGSGGGVVVIRLQIHLYIIILHFFRDRPRFARDCGWVAGGVGVGL